MAELNQIADYLPFLIPVIIIELGLAVAALVDVIRRPYTRLLSRTWWVLIIMLLGIVGPIVYFVAGREE